MVRKVVLYLMGLMLLFQCVGYAATYEKVLIMPDALAKNWIINIAGHPVWFDKNYPYSQDGEFFYMKNLEHARIGNIDLEHQIVEVVKDNGQKIYWEPYLTKKLKSFGGKEINFQNMAAEIQSMFYLDNPYERHPDWSDRAWEAIRNQQVYVGMTQEMCLMSWGSPDRVNKTTTAYGTREQWIYKYGYLYLDDGTLSAIQN